MYEDQIISGVLIPRNSFPKNFWHQQAIFLHSKFLLVVSMTQFAAISRSPGIYFTLTA